MQQAAETKLATQAKPIWLTASVAALMVGLMAWLRLGALPSHVLPIGYGLPLILFVWLRDRRLLWFTAAAFALVSIVKFSIVFPRAAAPQFTSVLVADVLLIMFDLLVITYVVDSVIAARARLETSHRDVELANHDLAQREEEISRQNEELQSQTEELERQSEELRVANEDLAQRERMLETLLDLSRALTVEMSQNETMAKVCETLGQLINGRTSATAILLKEGENLVVRCHYGFGPEGLTEDRIHNDQSFAHLVLSQMRTGYLEDLSLRPDLKVPQPKSDDPIVSILAAPLMVRGRGMGTLEIYSREKRSWSDEQIALAESLAAQAAISLESASLFEEIERERNRLAAVLRAVPFGLLICDAGCKQVRANPAGAALMNIPSETSLNASDAFSHVVAVRDGQPIAISEHPLAIAARDGIEIHGEELEWLLPGGRRVNVLISAVPVRERDGTLLGAVSVKADVTQLKTLQRELDLRRREAEEANVRKTRFLAAASHDIRTPANAISLLAELIKRSAESPALVGDVRQLAGDLQASALSLVELVTNVLDVTRFDTDKLELRESDFPLAALLDEETRQVQPLAQAKNLAIEVERAAPPVWLRADRIKLGRVIGNLLSNAIKFTDEGRVRISIRRLPDNAVQIAVTDTGIGINIEHQSKIFDEFYTLSDPQRSKGTGLGLAICKRLVDAMGGELTVRSAAGQGSTFTVTLPASCVIARPDGIPVPAGG